MHFRWSFIFSTCGLYFSPGSNFEEVKVPVPNSAEFSLKSAPWRNWGWLGFKNVWCTVHYKLGMVVTFCFSNRNDRSKFGHRELNVTRVPSRHLWDLLVVILSVVIKGRSEEADGSREGITETLRRSHLWKRHAAQPRSVRLNGVTHSETWPPAQCDQPLMVLMTHTYNLYIVQTHSTVTIGALKSYNFITLFGMNKDRFPKEWDLSLQLQG